MTIPRSFAISNHLAEKGHQVTVISGLNRKSGFSSIKGKKMINELRLNKIKIILMGVPYTHFMSYAKRLMAFVSFMGLSTVKAILLEKPDLVFATSTPLTTGLPAFLLCKLKRIPFVFEVRDLWPEFAVDMGILKNPFLIKTAEFVEKICYKEAVKIFTISDGLRNRLIQRGIPAEKVRKIPIGVDLDFTNTIEADWAFRKKNGLDGKFVAVYVGAHGVANGLEMLVKTAEYLKNKKDIVIVSIGEGKEKDNLIAMTQAKGLENMKFFEAMPRKELLAVMKTFDVGLMITKNLVTSMDECPNLPRKFFDYLACSLPVLVNSNGEMQRIVEQNNAGVSSSETNVSELAENLVYLKSIPLELYRKNVSELVKKYDLVGIGDEFEKEFLKAVF